MTGSVARLSFARYMPSNTRDETLNENRTELRVTPESGISWGTFRIKQAEVRIETVGSHIWVFVIN